MATMTKCPKCGGQIKNGVCSKCGSRVTVGKKMPPAKK